MQLKHQPKFKMDRYKSDMILVNNNLFLDHLGLLVVTQNK